MADTKNQAPAAKPVAETEAENVKVVVPKGTVPTSMQAGPSLPHPSSDEPPVANYDEEQQDALIRSQGFDPDAPEDGATPEDNVGEPEGSPIECIARRKFFDERNAVVKAGAIYYYQPRKGKPFPWSVLEPVNKGKAKALKKEWDESQAKKEERKAARRKASDNLALMLTNAE